MTTKKIKKLTLDAITEDMAKCMNGDGHGQYYASYYTNAGWPAWFVKPMTCTVKSDRRDHKSTLFDKDGNVIEKLDGVVNSLFFHRDVCDHLSIPYEEKYGRGSQAGACSRAFFAARKQHAEAVKVMA